MKHASHIVKALFLLYLYCDVYIINFQSSVYTNLEISSVRSFYVNTKIIKCIYHPDVKLQGELSVSWRHRPADAATSLPESTGNTGSVLKARRRAWWRHLLKASKFLN
jgi:hypothetical protein